MWSSLRFNIRRANCLILGALSFVYLSCLVNPAQMLSVVLLPFSRRAFRGFNRACASHVWGFWLWMCKHVARIDIRCSGDALPPKENVLVLSNHQSMADIMMLLWLGQRCERLGDTKFFVKDVLKFVPGPGWGMVFLDYIFLKRDWTRDKTHIESLFERFGSEDIPLFLVSFVEGTRFRSAKLARAQEFARQRGLHVPQHTLVPRSKGVLATLDGLGDHLDAVYDVTLGYERVPAPSLFDCFAMRVSRIDIHVTRYPLKALPLGDEAALEAWIRDCYQKKDERLAQRSVGA
jgi:1-acyl-sn-glycerol-3-phosphate acyltransferase